MTSKELELIGQLTEVAMTVTELKAENKILKDINEKLIQALRIHDVVGQNEQLVCDSCGCHPSVIYTTSKGKFCEMCKPAS